MFGSSRCIEALMGDEVGGVLDAADSTPEPDVFPAAEGRSSSAPTAVVHDADPLLFVLPEQFSRKVDAELVDAAAFSPPVVTGMVAPPKLRRGESVPTEVYSSSDSHVVSCPNCARKVPKTEFGQHMFLCYHVNTRPSEAAPVRGVSAFERVPFDVPRVFGWLCCFRWLWICRSVSFSGSASITVRGLGDTPDPLHSVTRSQRKRVSATV